MPITNWIWLTDPKFTTNYPKEGDESRRKLKLVVARIMKQMDGTLFESIDVVNRDQVAGVEDPDEYEHRTPIQSWSTSAGCHLFAWSDKPVDTGAAKFNNRNIRLAFAAYQSGTNQKCIPFVGANLHDESLSELRKHLKGDGWGDALRDRIVECFNDTATPPVVPNTGTVTDVIFIFRPENPSAKPFLQFFLKDPKITNRTPFLRFNELMEVSATLNHS